MPRPKFINTAKFPYHVTARTNNKDWYSVPLGQIWDIYVSVLTETVSRYGIETHLFVLMTNHFHMIVSAPNENLPRAMRYFLTEVSRAIGLRTNRINHIFGGRYRWSVLWTSRDLAYVYKYVSRNPVRAGICQRVEDYPYSSLNRLLLGENTMPIVEGIGSFWKWIPKALAARNAWLNVGVGTDEERLISLGLRRYEFQLPHHSGVSSLKKLLDRSYLPPEPVDNFEKELGTF